MPSKIASAKIHPSIGISRLGNSPEGFFFGPEIPGVPPAPIGGFKDSNGRIKRQTPLFRIFGYDADGKLVEELTADNADIEWTVHLANKKAAWKQFQSHFVTKEAPLRNKHVDDRTQLVIDPGARTISGRSTRNNKGSSRFSFDSGKFFDKPVYLGELQTDDAGRLLVLGGRGTSEPRSSEFNYIRQYANNDNWHDDVSDGPVTATVKIDGSDIDVLPAWVIVAPPDFSPHTYNLVTAFDVMLEVAINQGWLKRPKGLSFTRDVFPILSRAIGYAWVNANSLRGHGVGEPGDLLAEENFHLLSNNNKEAKGKRQELFSRIRRPDISYTADATYYFMPQLSGDGGNTGTGDKTLWLTVTTLQYEMLRNWADGNFEADWPKDANPRQGSPIPPSYEIDPYNLDRASVEACVGGAFYPGIEITYIATDVGNYREAFRLDDRKLQAGDITKWMAVPWQADFFECYDVWWPAQRPDDVITETAYRDALEIWGAGVSGADPKPIFLNYIEGRENWARGLTDEVSLALDPDGNPIPDPVNPGTDENPNFLKYHFGDLAMVRAWKDMGFVYPAQSPDDNPILIEHERSPYAGLQDLREFFHILLNIDDHPDFLPKAREIADFYLADAWRRMHEDKFEAPQYRFFPYTPEALHNRLMDIYVAFQEDGDNYEPSGSRDELRDYLLIRLRQLAPFNQLDGAWLRNVTQAGPIEEINSLLFSIWADEIGNGTTFLSHCNLYTELLASVGIHLPDIRSREYAEDPQFFRSAFEAPVFELAISQFSIDYFPELLGMTLQLEWEVLSLRRGVKRLQYVGIDAKFYIMHIGIDNASEGHGAKAKRAIELYLDHMYRQGGEELLQATWKRIWTAYVAFAITGSLGDDIARAAHDKRTRKQDEYLNSQVQDLIASKREYAQYNHATRILSQDYLNDLFKDPPRLMQALQDNGYIVPGDPEHSQFFTRVTTFDGPMFKVFTDDELETLKEWTRSLKTSPTPPSPVPSDADLMVDAIDRLKGDGSIVPAHSGFPLTGTYQGSQRTESVAWWLGNADSPTILKVLSESPHILRGNPASSDFYTTYLDLGNGMGQRWNVTAKRDPSRTYRDIAFAWIKAGCPLPTSAVGPSVALSRHDLLNLEGIQRREAVRTADTKPLRRRRVNPYGMHAVH